MATPTIIILVVVILMVAYLAIKSSPHDDEDSPLISLVFFLRSPRTITVDQLTEHVSKALDVGFDPDDEDATDFVMGTPTPPVDEAPEGLSCFMVSAGGGMFMVNNCASPYVHDVEDLLEGIEDERLRKVVAGHEAWLSVDAMGDVSDATIEAVAYSMIGRVMAELAGDDCIAICCPHLERVNEYDPELLVALRSDDPRAIFGAPTFAPVINVDADDPRIISAVAEARSRWSEFVAAFECRTDDKAPFAVKAEFEEGDRSEFMWLSVKDIDGDIVHGVLENKPNELSGIERGQKVEVNALTLNDWLFIRDDEPVGGFTMRAIKEIHESQQVAQQLNAN